MAVDDLAERLTVTPQTIRRDLNELCEQGHLTRVHGGAILESGVANLAYDARRSKLTFDERRKPALCADFNARPRHSQSQALIALKILCQHRGSDILVDST